MTDTTLNVNNSLRRPDQVLTCKELVTCNSACQEVQGNELRLTDVLMKIGVSYQYQKLAVEDLAADCASTASVHTPSVDLSHHGKPNEQKTAKRWENKLHVCMFFVQ